ncbi:phosphoribosylamine--glycine ligase [Candidatus Micrarchaeota archaeon]|nr:phosphoribosylamine--glycine ligase [Candidatus Micrarchaeota archaeon]MBU1165505.1 phosphoribosylamine--glycine ligase [Candidatus Micrarchaeota archaeon]MBU1886343.1 phosphoribosylamine--glycine ligase [Candidatus Micrarchaeota archaeon]
MRTLIVGTGGRESALAKRMAEHSRLYAFMKYANPTLIEHTKNSGGKASTGNILDPKEVAKFAQRNRVDLVMVSADDPLAAGVVDELLLRRIPTIGPTRLGAEIEWNKTFSRELVQRVDPDANPLFRIATSAAEIDSVFEEIGDMEVAVKPKGLTGGKGVKVMGPHLRDRAEAKQYAKEILSQQIGKGEAVVIEEKIDGVEFTLQAITDGKTIVFPPATYDHPYRFEGDTGPGTGGMGAFNVLTPHLPFMTAEQYVRVCQITQKVVDELDRLGRHFNGVLNGGFFISRKGVKVIEFNARFGDPECMNIMTMLTSNWVNAMEKIHEQRLAPEDIRFNGQASVVVYLVSPDYAVRTGESYIFKVDKTQIENAGCNVFFSAAEKTRRKNEYRTVGTSRSVGIAATNPDIYEARSLIGDCIEQFVSGPLQWRKDIATKEEIAALTKSGEELNRR